MGHPIGVGLSVSVGIVALGLLVMALLAWRRSEDNRLLYLVAAFGVFVTKGALAYAEHMSWISHSPYEVTHAALDLTIVLLLVAPFLHRA